MVSCFQGGRDGLRMRPDTSAQSPGVILFYCKGDLRAGALEGDPTSRGDPKR